MTWDYSSFRLRLNSFFGAQPSEQTSADKNKSIKEKEDFIRERGMGAVGALMGPVMSEFKGKMDGGDINKLLMEKIKEIL